MTDLLHVAVESREGAAVVLRVRLLPAEQGPFCTSHAFAWMLVDPYQGEHDGDLPPETIFAAKRAYDAISEANPTSGAEELGRLLIPDLAVTDVQHYRRCRPLGRGDAPQPEALYHLRFAGEALAAHLLPGRAWSSTAFDEAGTGLFLPYPPADLRADRIGGLLDLPSDAREAEARAARADTLRALLAWADPRLGGEVPVDREDYFLCTDIAPAFDGEERARVMLIDAQLRAVHGDAAQNVLDLVIGAIGCDPGSAEAHAMLYETLAGNADLVWEDAVERLPRLAPDAQRFFDHVLERAACWQSGDPAALPLAPRAGATLADAASLAAEGQLAEAIAARRGATGEDFAAARRAVCAG